MNDPKAMDAASLLAYSNDELECLFLVMIACRQHNTLTTSACWSVLVLFLSVVATLARIPTTK